MELEQISSIELATLNDELRKKIPNLPYPHMFVATYSVACMPEEKLLCLIKLVKTFDSFTEDIDPRGEHDLIAITFDGVKYYAKFDYFDEKLKYFKPGCRHVLTLLRAEEW